MLTRLREIVEKVASAPRLNEALNILVTDICLAMETEVCSVYLADHDRRCYYLMATRGLKKPRGRTVTLAFDEGIVGLVGRLAEPINLADAQKHPSFKYIPSVKEERFRAFLGVPIIQRRQLLGVLVVQQRELRQYDESEESFLVTLATAYLRYAVCGCCLCIKNANCYHYSFSNTRNRNEISVSSWDSAARRSAPPRGVFQ